MVGSKGIFFENMFSNERVSLGNIPSCERKIGLVEYEQIQKKSNVLLRIEIKSNSNRLFSDYILIGFSADWFFSRRNQMTTMVETSTKYCTYSST